MENGDKSCFNTMKRWMENRNEGKKISDYFAENKFFHISVYGAGDLGRLFYEEIRNSEIRVDYFVDRNAEALKFIYDIPVILPIDICKQKNTDIMVITPVGSYDSIVETLFNNYPEIGTISLKDIMYEM